VRLWLQQRDAIVVEAHLRKLPVELALPRRAVPARELVEHHPARVVPVPRVLAAGVAETDDQQVERRGTVASAPREAHLALGAAGLALLARSRVGRRLGGAFGRTFGCLFALGDLALGQLLALLDLRLRLLDAGREPHGCEDGLLRVVQVGHTLQRSEV